MLLLHSKDNRATDQSSFVLTGGNSSDSKAVGNCFNKPTDIFSSPLAAL